MIRKTMKTRSFPLALAAIAAALVLAAVPLVAAAQGAPIGGRGPGPGAGPGVGEGFGPGDGHCFAAGFGPGRGAGMLAGRGFERLARFLDLSEEQRTQAQAIHQATRDQVQPIFEESRGLRGELHELLAGEAPSATAVGEKVLALHANRDEVRRLHEAARTQFEALLTPEQLDELADLQERRQDRRERRGGRRGGPARF